jgi:hypothetical protein
MQVFTLISIFSIAIVFTLAWSLLLAWVGSGGNLELKKYFSFTIFTKKKEFVDDKSRKVKSS